VSAVAADWGISEYEQALEEIACKRADLRLEAWGIWQRSNGVPRVVSAGYVYVPPKDDDEEVVPESESTPPVILDWECEEVDRIVARFATNPFKKSLINIALIEYCTPGPREVKARRARITERSWREAVRRLQLTVAEELFRGA
jgi:hypothetical protein